MSSSNKTAWPEVVGQTGEEARLIINQEKSNGITVIQIIQDDAMVTMDYREDRVRIFVNNNGKVSRPPMIG